MSKLVKENMNNNNFPCDGFFTKGTLTQNPFATPEE